MSDYKRWISYVYSYENNIKKNNVGYVKVEKRYEKTKISVRINVLSISEPMKVYMYVRKNNVMEGIYIGDITLDKNNTQNSYLLNTELNSDIINVSETGGIVIYYSKEKYYASEWDDINIDINELRRSDDEEDTELVAMSIPEDAGDVLPNDGDELGNSGEVLPNAGDVQQDSGDVMQNSVDAQQDSGDALQDSVNVLQNSGDVYQNAGDVHQNAGDVHQNAGDVYQNAGDVHQNAGDVHQNAGDVLQNSGVVHQNAVDALQNDRESGWNSAEESGSRNPGWECENIVEVEDNTLGCVHGMVPGSEDNTQDCEHENAPGVGDNSNRREHESATGNEGHAQNNDQTPKSERRYITETHSSSEQADQVRISAERVLATYPKMFPFENDDMVRCVRIEPKDIGQLPIETWVLANNSFLLQGYYRYRHLMLLCSGEKEKAEYLIGVPGIYRNRDEYMAGLFGFGLFKPMNNSGNLRGEFGYWCIRI